MPRTPYLWIRDLDPINYMHVLKLARAQRKSVSDTAYGLLLRYLDRDDSEENSTRSRVEAKRRAKIKVRRI